MDSLADKAAKFELLKRQYTAKGRWNTVAEELVRMQLNYYPEKQKKTDFPPDNGKIKEYFSGKAEVKQEVKSIKRSRRRSK